MEDMFMCIMIINTAMSVTKIRRKKTRWVFRERQEAGDFTQLILKAKQLGDACISISIVEFFLIIQKCSNHKSNSRYPLGKHILNLIVIVTTSLNQ